MNFSLNESEEVRQLKKQLAQDELYLSQLRQAKVKSDEELVDLRSKVKSLQTANDQGLARLDEAERKETLMREDRDRKALANANLEQALQQTKAQLQQREKNRRLDDQTREDALSRRERELLADRSELENRCNTLETRLREAQNSMHGQAGPSNPSSHSSRLMALENENAVLKAELERTGLTPSLDSPGARSVHSKRSRRSSGINVTGSEEQQLREINSELSDQIEKTEARASRAEREALKASNERLASERRNQGAIEALTTERDELKDEIKLREDHVNDLERQLNGINTLLGGHESSFDDCQAKVRELLAKSHDADAARQVLSTLSGPVNRSSIAQIQSDNANQSLADMATGAAKAYVEAQGHSKMKGQAMADLQRESDEMRVQLQTLDQTTEMLRRREKELAAGKRRLKKLSTTLRKALPSSAGLQSMIGDTSVSFGVGDETVAGDTTLGLRGFEADMIDELEQLVTYAEELDERLEFQRVENEVRESSARSELNSLKTKVVELDGKLAEAERIQATDTEAHRLDLEQAQLRLEQHLASHAVELAKVVAEHEQVTSILSKQTEAFSAEKEQLLVENRRALFEAEQREIAQADVAAQTATHLLGLLDHCQQTLRQEVDHWQVFAEDSAEEVWTVVHRIRGEQEAVKQALDGKKSEVTQLQSEVDGLRALEQLHRAKCDELEVLHEKAARLQTIEQAYGGKCGELKRAQSEVESLRSTEQAYFNRCEEVKKLHDELEVLRQTTETYKGKCAGVEQLQNRLQALVGIEDEQDRNLAEIGRMRIEISALRQTETAFNSSSAEMERLQEQVKKLANAEKLLEEERSAVRQHQTDIETLRAEVEEGHLKSKELERSQGEVFNLQGELQSLQDRVRRRSEQIGMLQIELEQERMNRKLAENALRKFVASRDSDETVLSDNEEKSKTFSNSGNDEDVGRLRTTILGLEEQLAMSDKRLAELEEERMSLLAELEETRESSDYASSRIHVLENELNGLEVTVTEARQASDENSKQLLALQTEQSSLKQDFAALEVEKQDLLRELRLAEETIEEMRGKEAAASTEHTATLTEFTSDRQKHTDSLRELEEELQAKNQALTDLEDQLSSAYGEADAARQQEEQLQRQVEGLQLELNQERCRSQDAAQNTDCMVALLEQLDNAEKRIEDTQTALAKVTEAHKQLKAQMTESEQQLIEAQATLSAVRAERDAEAATSRETVEQMRQELLANKQLSDVVVSERDSLRSELTNVNERARGAKEELEKLTEKLDKARGHDNTTTNTAPSPDLSKMIAELKEKLATGAIVIEQLEQELAQKAQECEDADDKELALRKDNKRLVARIATLQAKLEKYQTQAQKLAEVPNALAVTAANAMSSNKTTMTMTRSPSDTLGTRKRRNPDEEGEEASKSDQKSGAKAANNSPQVDRACVYAPGPTSLTTTSGSRVIRERTGPALPANHPDRPTTAGHDGTPNMQKTSDSQTTRRDVHGVHDDKAGSRGAEPLSNSLNRSTGSKPSDLVAMRLQQKLAGKKDAGERTNTGHSGAVRLKDRTNKPREANAPLSSSTSSDPMAAKLVAKTSSSSGIGAGGDNNFMAKLNRFRTPTAATPSAVVTGAHRMARN